MLWSFEDVRDEDEALQDQSKQVQAAYVLQAQHQVNVRQSWTTWEGT